MLTVNLAFPRADLHQPGAMLAYIMIFLFDAAVFALTVYKAVKMRRNGGGRLVKIIFRDGWAFSLTAHFEY